MLVFVFGQPWDREKEIGVPYSLRQLAVLASFEAVDPIALRHRLSTGLPLSEIAHRELICDLLLTSCLTTS